jgi:hypothetical protein
MGPSPLGGGDRSLSSVHFLADAAIVLTSIEIEDSNLPDAELTSTTAGEWIKEDPTGGYVAKVGAGVTVTNLTISKTAGAIGAAMVHLGNAAAKRERAKIVVGAAGGVLRIATHGKGR